ncbi:MAG: hypothetical protein WCK05_10540 [Planctomycetota bacterium]
MKGFIQTRTVKLRAVAMLFVSMAGCEQAGLGQSFVAEETRVAMGVSLRQMHDGVIDHRKVAVSVSEDLCHSVELSVGNKRVRLLGFAPTIDSVQCDVRDGVTWVSLLIGTRHTSYLVLRCDSSKVSGIVLVDQESSVEPSTICFAELGMEYGERMTEMNDKDLFVDQQFLETASERGDPGIEGVIPVAEVQYSRPMRIHSGSEGGSTPGG